MWHGILGHDDVVERFRRTIRGGRLASTYLFVGSSGIGKRRFALQLAGTLLCPESEEASLEPCGRCESCRLFAAGNHPDLDQVSLPPDKSALPIALFIGEKEQRNQEGLCHRLSLKPFLGRRKIAVIDDADHFNQESANCLLKTLEEPPPESLLILIGTSPARQLPTIRSRAQIVRFSTLSTATVQQILLDRQLVDPARAELLAEVSDGSLERALELSEPELWEFRGQLQERLARPRWDAVQTAKWVLDFVQAAGQEAPRRRGRLRLGIGFAMEFYRAQLREGAERGAADPTLLDSLEACLAAVEQVDRNANLALVVSYWLRALRGGSVAQVVEI